MNLVVDIGNSLTKVALYDRGESVEFCIVENPLSDKLVLIKGKKIERGIISSVSSDVYTWTSAFPEVEWLILSAETKVPFINKYETPQTLGLDRIALVSAAATNYPLKNVLIIDAGTCVTFDFLSASGAYFGGAISPGLEMRLKAMHEFTSKLPLVSVSPAAQLIGNSTKSSLQSGALNGLAAEIDGTIRRYSNQFEDLIIVLTGGDTKVLVPLVKSGIFAPRKFLLDGLHAILAYNVP